MKKISEALNIDDLRLLAGRRLPSFLFQYVERGNGNGMGWRATSAASRNT